MCPLRDSHICQPSYYLLLESKKNEQAQDRRHPRQHSSTRNGDKVANWITKLAQEYGQFDVELVDLQDYPLPLFDAPASDAWMPTPNETAAKWQAKLKEFDGYIVVSAEYNRSIPGALKNAIDWAYTPFVRKAVAVSYTHLTLPTILRV